MYIPVYKSMSKLSTMDKAKVKTEEMVLKFYGISFEFDPTKFPDLDMVKYQEYLKPANGYYDHVQEPVVFVPKFKSILEAALFPSCRAHLRNIADSMNRATYIHIMNPPNRDWQLGLID
ncbi:MAG: hypothetical protein WAQ98_02690 [Blastocatellia bacterium]